jgi:membrane protein YqaA with SNARE-associated domain
LANSQGFFLSALVSATVLPGVSEAVLVGVLALGQSTAMAAVGVATAGNTLGSVVNWLIGRYLGSYRDHPRFPVSPERYDRYVAAFRRWGAALLFLSWVPLLGDPLTVVAGVLRTPLWLFVPIVALAKLARYLVVAGAVELF